MQQISSYFARLKTSKILVVGDVMLDRYWFGDVDRISPEAPVPIVKIDHQDERPGGAANVACNAASLGAVVDLFAIIGQDEPAVVLNKLLTALGVNCVFQKDASLATTVKLRVIGRQQQLLRLDFEAPPSEEILDAKLNDFSVGLPSSDVVIFSDYGKGGLRHIREMIALAKKIGKPTLVDPKGDDYSKYTGATLLTPNRGEFRQIVGAWRSEQMFVEKAQNLRSALQLEALLITRSEEGMSLFLEDSVHHIPAQSREVYDVTGAGDTVIAVLGALLASGADLLTATQWANQAAGIVVEKLGTATITIDELLSSVR